MICKNCKQDKVMYARERCYICYNRLMGKFKFIMKTSRPLRQKEIEHNTVLLYDKLKLFKKRKTRTIVGTNP